jgi:hypothetical protein
MFLQKLCEDELVLVLWGIAHLDKVYEAEWRVTSHIGTHGLVVVACVLGAGEASVLGLQVLVLLFYFSCLLQLFLLLLFYQRLLLRFLLLERSLLTLLLLQHQLLLVHWLLA